MHPYRTSAPNSDPEPASDHDELVIYALLVAIGVIPVIVALALGAALGTEATLGAAMLAVGLAGLARRRHTTR
jgi:hypothetical protein